MLSFIYKRFSWLLLASIFLYVSYEGFISFVLPGLESDKLLKRLFGGIFFGGICYVFLLLGTISIIGFFNPSWDDAG